MHRAVILFGLVLHAAILLPPVLLCGRFCDPAVWFFVLLASVFYLGDATAAPMTAFSMETCQPKTPAAAGRPASWP